MEIDLFGTLEESRAYLGVDFGTFKCMAAVKEEDDRPEILSLSQLFGLRSLFWASRDGDEICVCDEVETMNYHINDPAGVVTSPKMLLTADKLDYEVKIGSRTFTPDQINEQILRRVFDKASKALEMKMIQDIERICVGVPVIFGHSSRNQLMSILKRIGYENVELLSEPMAAAEYAAYRTRGRLDAPVLVFDMGAGTYDLTLMKENESRCSLRPEPYLIMDSYGDTNAGDVCDKLMLKLIIDRSETPMDVPAAGSNNYRLLLDQARETKERLTEADPNTVVRTRYTADDGISFYSSVSLRDFEQRITDLVIRPNVAQAADMIDRNGLRDKKFYVIMVGGSTLMPIVRAALEKEFSHLDKKLIMNFEPDRAIALGCALYAEKPAFIRKVSYAYGFETHAPGGSVGVDICIPSMVELPYVHQVKYSTLLPSQNGAHFNIYEVEYGNRGDLIPLIHAKNTHYSFTHDFKRSVPRGTVMNVIITLTADGIIQIQFEDDFGNKTNGTLNIGLNKE